MPDLLPTWPILLGFLAASLVLAVTPGPGVIYIVARSIAQGRAAGLASVAGVAAGNFGNAMVASLGLAAVLSVSSGALAIVKYAGAAYLIYLGVRALRDPVRPGGDAATRRQQPPRRVFLDGLVIALLNPKTALFFAAFLPQFMTAEAPSVFRTIALGTLFVGVAAASDTAYALTAARVAPQLNRGTRMTAASRYLAGGVLVGLGIFTALSGPRLMGRP